MYMYSLNIVAWVNVDHLIFPFPLGIDYKIPPT